MKLLSLHETPTGGYGGGPFGRLCT